MANILEQRGFFWWFNEPHLPAHSKETSIPGLLTVTDDGQSTLKTDGPLCGNGERADWLKPRCPRQGQMPSALSILISSLAERYYVFCKCDPRLPGL